MAALVTGQVDSKLVGSWTLGGQPFVTFKANGSGSMDGESFKWKAKGGVVTLTADGESEQAQYEVDGAQLVLVMGGMPIALQRSGRAAPAQAAAPVRDDGDGDDEEDASPRASAPAP